MYDISFVSLYYFIKTREIIIQSCGLTRLINLKLVHFLQSIIYLITTFEHICFNELYGIDFYIIDIIILTLCYYLMTLCCGVLYSYCILNYF